MAPQFSNQIASRVINCLTWYELAGLTSSFSLVDMNLNQSGLYSFLCKFWSPLYKVLRNTYIISTAPCFWEKVEKFCEFHSPLITTCIHLALIVALIMFTAKCRISMIHKKVFQYSCHGEGNQVIYSLVCLFVFYNVLHWSRWLLIRFKMPYLFFLFVVELYSITLTFVFKLKMFVWWLNMFIQIL